MDKVIQSEITALLTTLGLIILVFILIIIYRKYFGSKNGKE